MQNQDWLEDIWDKLHLTYGQGLLRRYDGMEIANVKANWHHELARFITKPGAFMFALSNLPADSAPTVLQFAELCRAAPTKDTFEALPAPEVDQAGVRKVMAKLLRAIRPEKKNDPKAWAYRLKEREERGTGLTLFQRQCWREALKTNLEPTE